MGIVACTVGEGLLCLCVAGAIRLGATDGTFRRRAIRGWLIAAGVCVLVCVVLPIAASFLDLAGHNYLSLLLYSCVPTLGNGGAFCTSPTDYPPGTPAYL